MSDQLQPPTIEVPTVSIPVSSPAVVDIPSVPAVEQIDASAALGLARVKGPKEALGEESFEEEKPDTRERDPATGKFIEKTDGKPPEAKPVAAKKAVAKTVAKAAAPTAPTAQAKVKIGDEERTAEEWAAHLAELKGAKEKPTEAAKTAEQPPTDTEPDEAKREADFIAAVEKDYTPTAEEFDDMLATGNPSILARYLAKAQLRAQQTMCDQFNKALERIEAQINPLAKRNAEIEQFQTEASFLKDNPDISSHTEGQKTAREVGTDLHDEYDRLQRMVAAKVAVEKDHERIKTLESNWFAEVSKATKLRLGIPLTQSAPATAAVITPPASQPKLPPGGDRPGGIAASRTESPQARLAREMAEHDA